MAKTRRSSNVLRAALGATALAAVLAACVAPPVSHPTTTTTTSSTTTSSTTTLPASADLAVSLSIDTSSPYYWRNVVLTTTVHNGGGDPAAGVTVDLPLPSGLTFISSSSGYDATTGTWTIGTVAPQGDASLTVTARAGDVLDGTQTVSATVLSATADPNASNNTDAVTEQSQPAPISAAIIPNPGNPSVVDISVPAAVGWTAVALAADNPGAPAPTAYFLWSCTAFGPCPENPSFLGSHSSITFESTSLQVDTYVMFMTVTAMDPNYQAYPEGQVAVSTQFTTINSGSD
jgi:uncharacterized repeat protein (TIGR01451 family)